MRSAPFCLIDNRHLDLFLRPHKEDFFPFSDIVPYEEVGLLKQANGLFQVDNMNPLALGEDIPSHLGVPLARLVTEMHTGFQQFFHCQNFHIILPIMDC